MKKMTHDSDDLLIVLLLNDCRLISEDLKNNIEGEKKKKQRNGNLQ